MGITGLLPFLKKASRPVNIKDFAGCTVAVDAYCWLHRGAYSCADRLAKGEKTDGYVFYCMKMVNVLLNLGVRPILVFDGCNLPSKAATEAKRREQRTNNKINGKEFLRQGKIKEARECFQRCIDITPEMALELIKACHNKGVDCIVAPYEADAQLAYLAKKKIVQLVITEDSDLLLFGCEKILFKFDANGNGVLIEQSKLSLSFNNSNFSFDKFRHMCILSGCDYHPSLPGIGLSTSYKFFSKVNNPNLDMVLPKLPVYLKKPNLIVSPEYIEGFIRANNTFLYQLVFDPAERQLVPLNPYPPEINPSELDYAGKYLPNDVAYQLALGNINIKTLKQMNNFDPNQMAYKPKSSSSNSNPAVSIWSSNFKVKETIPAKVDNHKKETSAPKAKEVVVHFQKSLGQRFKHKTISDLNNEISDKNLTAIYNSSADESPKENDISLLSSNNEASETTSPLTTNDILQELEINKISEKKDTENNDTISTSKLSVTPKARKLPVNRFCVTEPINKKKVRSRFFSSSKPETVKQIRTSNRALDYFEKLSNENTSSQNQSNSDSCIDYFGFALLTNSATSSADKETVFRDMNDDGISENKNNCEELSQCETAEINSNYSTIKDAKNSKCKLFQWKSLDTFAYKKIDNSQRYFKQSGSEITETNLNISSSDSETSALVNEEMPLEADQTLNDSELDSSLNLNDGSSQISNESGIGSSPSLLLDPNSDSPNETVQLKDPNWKVLTYGLKRKLSSTPEMKKGNNTKIRCVRPSGLFKKKPQKTHTKENNVRQLSLEESLAKFKFNRISSLSSQNDVLTPLDNFSKRSTSVDIS